MEAEDNSLQYVQRDATTIAYASRNWIKSVYGNFDQSEREQKAFPILLVWELISFLVKSSVIWKASLYFFLRRGRNSPL